MQVSAQTAWETNAGLGLYEGMSIKAKYGENWQLGLSQGFAMGSFWLTGVEGYYHFAGSSPYVDQAPFYVLCGLSSTVITPGYSRFEKINIYPRIGITINFSARFGLNLDLGPNLLLFDDIYGYESAWLPSGSIHFFVRILQN